MQPECSFFVYILIYIYIRKTDISVSILSSKLIGRRNDISTYKTEFLVCGETRGSRCLITTLHHSSILQIITVGSKNRLTNVDRFFARVREVLPDLGEKSVRRHLLAPPSPPCTMCLSGRELVRALPELAESTCTK